MVANEQETLLVLTNAGVVRENRWLVENIDLTLHRGEIVTLIGYNGSGKTTTAKLALGILKPDSGKIWRKPDLIMGYVPQKLSIDRSMPISVSWLIKLTCSIDQKEITRLLHDVGVGHLEHAQIAHLSGGELQRVLLARAIARKPDILVLDEPLQGIDFRGESELYELIATLRTTLNCAILLISHDLHIVMASTDRVICLNGHICCSGTPEVVAASDVYYELLGGKPNLAIYHHQHNHRHDLEGHIYPETDASDCSHQELQKMEENPPHA